MYALIHYDQVIWICIRLSPYSKHSPICRYRLGTIRRLLAALEGLVPAIGQGHFAGLWISNGLRKWHLKREYEQVEEVGVLEHLCITTSCLEARPCFALTTLMQTRDLGAWHKDDCAPVGFWGFQHFMFKLYVILSYKLSNIVDRSSIPLNLFRVYFRIDVGYAIVRLDNVLHKVERVYDPSKHKLAALAEKLSLLILGERDGAPACSNHTWTYAALGVGEDGITMQLEARVYNLWGITGGKQQRFASRNLKRHISRSDTLFKAMLDVYPVVFSYKPTKLCKRLNETSTPQAAPAAEDVCGKKRRAPPDHQRQSAEFASLIGGYRNDKLLAYIVSRMQLVLWTVTMGMQT